MDELAAEVSTCFWPLAVAVNHANRISIANPPLIKRDGRTVSVDDSSSRFMIFSPEQKQSNNNAKLASTSVCNQLKHGPSVFAAGGLSAVSLPAGSLPAISCV